MAVRPVGWIWDRHFFLRRLRGVGWIDLDGAVEPKSDTKAIHSHGEAERENGRTGGGEGEGEYTPTTLAVRQSAIGKGRREQQERGNTRATFMSAFLVEGRLTS